MSLPVTSGHAMLFSPVTVSAVLLSSSVTTAVALMRLNPPDRAPFSMNLWLRFLSGLQVGSPSVMPLLLRFLLSTLLRQSCHMRLAASPLWPLGTLVAPMWWLSHFAAYAACSVRECTVVTLKTLW